MEQPARQFVVPITDRPPLPTVGAKAFNLHRLQQLPVPVPATHAVTWDAYQAYRRDEVTLIDQLRQQLEPVVDPQKRYAVRSSADVEDDLAHSCAGQFTTMLDVQGEADVLAAIWAVWSSAAAQGAQIYLADQATPQQPLRMGVILQEMVTPCVSGVAFSRNPITGADEVIVEAVEGAGTALVQDGVTPCRWVHRDGSWHARPEQTPIPAALIDEVVDETRRIADACGDVDLEWVYDGQQLHWVQLRAITALEEPTVYSNRIAREVLPGLIKPLIWSINIPLVNGAWVALLTELVGDNDLRVDDLARSFYYRTYFNMSSLGRIWAALGLPQESLEILMGVVPRPEGERLFRPTWPMVRLTPRLLRFAWHKWGLSDVFRQEYPRLVETLAGFDWQDAADLDEDALLDRIAALDQALHRLAYYNIIVPLLMALYNAFMVRILKRCGVDATRFDMLEGMTAHRQYAPDWSLDELRRAVAEQDPALRARLEAISYEEFLALPGLEALQQRVVDFITRFGHLSDSGNDFSVTPWRENPELVLRLMAQHVASPVREGDRIRFADLPLRGVRRRWAAVLYRRARDFRLYREQISDLYTFGYGLFRPYFRALGDRLAARGLLAQADDIFYLSRQEAEALALSGGGAASPADRPVGDAALRAQRRRAEMARCRDIELPTVIHGHAVPLTDESAARLRGVATARGTYTGPVRTVRSLSDFDRVRAGDVLVIPYSDVGWTPLFARAGAVIAESGGMLSHSSIVAREYQIPAVVSVSGAMRLPDGLLVTVDGYQGEILLHEENEAAPADRPPAAPAPANEE